jgi:hypothetical protein
MFEQAEMLEGNRLTMSEAMSSPASRKTMSYQMRTSSQRRRRPPSSTT